MLVLATALLLLHKGPLSQQQPLPATRRMMLEDAFANGFREHTSHHSSNMQQQEQQQPDTAGITQRSGPSGDDSSSGGGNPALDDSSWGDDIVPHANPAYPAEGQRPGAVAHSSKPRAALTGSGSSADRQPLETLPESTSSLATRRWVAVAATLKIGSTCLFIQLGDVLWVNEPSDSRGM